MEFPVFPLLVLHEILILCPDLISKGTSLECGGVHGPDGHIGSCLGEIGGLLCQNGPK